MSEIPISRQIETIDESRMFIVTMSIAGSPLGAAGTLGLIVSSNDTSGVPKGGARRPRARYTKGGTQ
jgi:hypothetical protein